MDEPALVTVFDDGSGLEVHQLNKAPLSWVRHWIRGDTVVHAVSLSCMKSVQACRTLAGSRTSSEMSEYAVLYGCQGFFSLLT
jgi:hypothetical protein